jgi:transposase-like protein
MSGSSEKSDLSSRQQKAIACLLSEATVSGAANSAGVSERTLRRWLKQAEFTRVYQQARQESYRESLRLLRRAANAAIAVLVKVMQDVSAPKTARIRAAEVILDHDRRGVMEEDLLVRIQALEEQAPRPSR